MTDALVTFLLGVIATAATGGIGFLIKQAIGSLTSRLDKLERGPTAGNEPPPDVQRRVAMLEATVTHISRDAEDHKQHAAAIAVLQSDMITIRDDVTWIRRRLENFQVVSRQASI